MISRVSLVNRAPRLASLAPFCRLICDHLLWPDIGPPLQPDEADRWARSTGRKRDPGWPRIVPMRAPDLASATCCVRSSRTDAVTRAARPGDPADLPHPAAGAGRRRRVLWA